MADKSLHHSLFGGGRRESRPRELEAFRQFEPQIGRGRFASAKDGDLSRRWQLTKRVEQQPHIITPWAHDMSHLIAKGEVQDIVERRFARNLLHRVEHDRGALVEGDVGMLRLRTLRLFACDLHRPARGGMEVRQRRGKGHQSILEGREREIGWEEPRKRRPWGAILERHIEKAAARRIVCPHEQFHELSSSARLHRKEDRFSGRCEHTHMRARTRGEGSEQQ